MKLRSCVLALGFVLAAIAAKPEPAQAGGYSYGQVGSYGYNCPSYAYTDCCGRYYGGYVGYEGYYYRPYRNHYYGSYYYPSYTYYYPQRRQYRRAYRRHHRYYRDW